jgi:hypothetical protein
VATVPVPRTWVSGEFVVASYMNGIRDALNFLLQPPLCVAKQTVIQSISTAWAPVTMDAEDIDRDGGHSVASNTSRYTGQTPGWYRIDGTISWSANTSGMRGVSIWVNNASQYGYSSSGPPTNNAWGTSTSGTVFLNGTTDYAEVQGISPAGALNTSTLNGGSRMAVAYASVT